MLKIMGKIIFTILRQNVFFINLNMCLLSLLGSSSILLHHEIIARGTRIFSQEYP